MAQDRRSRAAWWLGASGLVVAIAAAPGAAEARSFFAFSLGVPLAVGPPAYYYAPPPAYVYPYQPPVVYAPPPAVAPAPRAQQTCREYQTTMMIDGRPQRAYGLACLQPDGSWRIVR